MIYFKYYYQGGKLTDNYSRFLFKNVETIHYLSVLRTSNPDYIIFNIENLA